MVQDPFDKAIEKINERRRSYAGNEKVAVFVDPDTANDIKDSEQLMIGHSGAHPDYFAEVMGFPFIEDKGIDGIHVLPETLDDYRPEEYVDVNPPVAHVEEYIERDLAKVSGVVLPDEKPRTQTRVPFTLERKKVVVRDEVKDADRLPVTGRSRFGEVPMEKDEKRDVTETDVEDGVAKLESEIKKVPITTTGMGVGRIDHMAEKALELQNTTLEEPVYGVRRYEHGDPSTDEFYEGEKIVKVGHVEYHIGTIAPFPHLCGGIDAVTHDYGGSPNSGSRSTRDDDGSDYFEQSSAW